MSKFNVGDTVLYVPGHGRREPMEVTVTKVGRKYLYVALYGRDFGFAMEDGVQNGNSYGYADRIYTPADWEASQREKATLEALVNRHNLSPSRGWWKQSPAVREKLLAFLDEQESLEQL